ncbi:MAG: hypothetical protein ACE37I_02845 [Rubinisphaera brasiliensis]|uniref:Cupin domain-containing protein n=1 Tax=Rubinisphaera brasiliensis (strain ATCC 49424 / DSM 5305 / JCM 21570 / IAM 15109 / NBRC 103401 / IFAM 1448) TaxID=756272 RepID=F0SNU3_RUBBR|nr:MULTISPECIES: hypothetical protein [Rubinisphaera]ADY60019.1 hypothetical protein Plabr_2418 [Rubinisphaera brasiliensis DSM 5305]MBR9802727.1 hypothetical protein [bacterium]
MSENDRRIYVPHNDGWDAHVKPNSTKEYCYFKAPGDDHFHLLMTGEVYVQKGSEKCCLNCALRMGIVTEERLHWQNPPKAKKRFPFV